MFGRCKAGTVGPPIPTQSNLPHDFFCLIVMSTPLLSDLRSSARSLRRSPTVALSAVACLALGIGATVAIASAIDRALVERLPFHEPTRLVTVYRTTPHFNTGPF